MKSVTSKTCSTAIAALSLAFLAGAGTALALPDSPAQTDAGLVTGIAGRDASITVYKGIPFAAPPIGNLRWREPQPAIPWTGIRQADQFGSACAQLQGAPGGPATVSGSEDCLYLNVWTKATTGDKRPVLVWIYGGRFIFGSGSQTDFDGESLARKGLVVVTLNYRNGVFGFLATPELSQESGHNASGDYGIMDQIAALRWVKANIAAFGGDPDRVTIAGQSAGSASVLHLLGSPMAKGLFHGAIAESGARFPNDPDISGLATSWRSLKRAEELGTQYAQQHGAKTLAELRALPAETLLQGNNANDDSVSPAFGGGPPPPIFRPVIDGWVIPRTYGATLAGQHSDVPVMTGNNKDENGAGPNPDITLTKYHAQITRRYGAEAAKFESLYPATTDADAGQAMNDAIREGSRASSYLWAGAWSAHAKSPVYTYYWTHAFPSREARRRTAYHGSEINYFFDNLDINNADWTDEDRQIADTMSNYWVNFATTGDPNGPNVPSWPRADATPQIMELGDNFKPIPVAPEARLKFMTHFFATQPQW